MRSPGVGANELLAPGAIVTQTETIVDTGERKTMFGYTARRVRTTSVMDAPPEACNPGHMEIESDGWYIDLAAGFSCDARTAPWAYPSARVESVSEFSRPSRCNGASMVRTSAR